MDELVPKKIIVKENSCIFRRRVGAIVFYFCFCFVTALIVFLVTKNEESSSPSDLRRCKNVSFCMNPFTTGTDGKWTNKSTTGYPWVQLRIKEIRRKLKLPENMTRSDKRCGLDYPLPNSRLPSMCDIDSTAGCCHEKVGRCMPCEEENERQKWNAFHTKMKVPPIKAVWVPKDKSCNLKIFSVEEACSILYNGTRKIIFLGDEQARHFHTAMVMFLSQNYKDGAIKDIHKSSRFIQQTCSYEYQLLNRQCRRYIEKSFATREICNIDSNMNIDLEYISDYQTYFSNITTLKALTDHIMFYNRTYIILGAGTHFDSDHASFINYYVKPLLESPVFVGDVYPNLIIETLHGVYSTISNSKRLIFNDKVKKFVQDSDINVSLFDNSLLTTDLESHDGRTYGVNFNMLKVQTFLHYLHNRNRGCN